MYVEQLFQSNLKQILHILGQDKGKKRVHEGCVSQLNYTRLNTYMISLTCIDDMDTSAKGAPLIMLSVFTL